MEEAKKSLEEKQQAKEKEKENTAIARKAAEKRKRMEKLRKEKQEFNEPVLVWLKQKGYCPQDETVIKKGYMIAAFNDHRAAIIERVRRGGQRINKQTGLATMVEMFKDHNVLQL